MNKKVLIECCSCRECFSINAIEYCTDSISEDMDREELFNFAEESSVRFDCPECGEPQYLSDCELF